MEATLDLAGIMERPGFDPVAFDELKELAFSNTESFDRFMTLAHRLANDVESGGQAPGQYALKLGAAFHLISDAEAAEKWLTKAAPSAERSFLLGQVYRDLRRYNDSLAALREARQQGHDAAECELQSAETLIAAGRIDEAAKALSGQREPSPATAHWHHVRGRLEEARGNSEAAAEAYRQALEVDEEFPPSLFHLAYLSHLYGDDDAARQLYQDCASLPYVHANALVNLAVVYEDDGDNEAAAGCLRRVLAVNPNHARAQLYMKDVVAAGSMYYDENQTKVQQQYDAILDIPVADFELSVRARNCLKKMNINTLGDLLRISERELLAYKNFGETSLSEIKAMLTQKGLSLGQLAGQQRPTVAVSVSGAPAARPMAMPAGNPEVLSRPVSTLELSVRARKCLQRLGINSIAELANTSEAELLASKNFGQTSLSEIKQRLAELGLGLRGK